MIKQYIQQALAQLRQHPIISGVTVVGTALAIFLIMLVVMMQQVQTVPFAPESNRDRLLYVQGMSIANTAWGDATSNGPMSAQTAKECFQSLTTPEAVTVHSFISSSPASLPGQPSTLIDVKPVDEQFFRVFDFTFLDGKPFEHAALESAQPLAVITQSVARAVFGTADGVVGKEFQINYAPYKVVGVVKDVSSLAKTAYAQCWIPYTTSSAMAGDWNTYMGVFSATILAKSRSDFPAIREEVNRKRDEFNKSIESDGWKLIYRNRPYDQEKQALVEGANIEPDVAAARRQRITIFVILLLVPAINLSSMTQSRLRQRIAEIGVRRAFGSTRTSILGQVLAENFIVTLLAGVLGLLFSIAFAFLGSSLLFTNETSYDLTPPMVDASILLHFSTFVWALFFCFILNLLSSGLPAWRASRISIVGALNGRLYN